MNHQWKSMFVPEYNKEQGIISVESTYKVVPHLSRARQKDVLYNL